MSKVSDFINRFGGDFVAATEGTKLFPSVKAAQAILETGMGVHVPGNNMFGIKANGTPSKYWKGDAIDATTQEVIKGEAQNLTQGFRKYDSIADSIKDHSEFLYENNRYKDVFLASTPEDQARALQKDGYATDPNYATKLIALIVSYNLYTLDQKKKL